MRFGLAARVAVGSDGGGGDVGGVAWATFLLHPAIKSIARNTTKFDTFHSLVVTEVSPLLKWYDFTRAKKMSPAQYHRRTEKCIARTRKHEFRATSTENLLLSYSRGGSAAKDHAAIDRRKRVRLNAQDDYEILPSWRRNLGALNQSECRPNDCNSQARGCLSRLKCSDGSIDRRIWPIDCRKEENECNAQNHKDCKNGDFPSDSAQNHRSATSKL
jgi:hypothetical protein